MTTTSSDAQPTIMAPSSNTQTALSQQPFVERLSWPGMLVLCLAFFGIQHGFEIQFANMSAIYDRLLVPSWLKSILWLPAPLMGFVVAPIVGNMSDKTWLGWLGRRRVYLLVGALLATIAMIWLPNVQTVLGAVLGLCLLDLSINVCMSPARALLADKLATEQLSTGFSIQGFMIGLGGFGGAWIASQNWLTLVPLLTTSPLLASLGSTAMHWQFYLSAAIFLTFILLTVLFTQERADNTPPVIDPAVTKPNRMLDGLKQWATDMQFAITHMPKAMQKMCVVQFFTWMGLFCFFMYYSTAVAKGIFPNNPDGLSLANQSKIFNAATSVVFALMLPWLAARFGRVWMHMAGLLVAGLGLLSVAVFQSAALLPWAMVGMGIGWCCILALPFTLVGEHVPRQSTGVYMGLFNLFIVIPEILAALGFGALVQYVFHGNELGIIGLGGGFMVLAAFYMFSMKAYNHPAPAVD